MVAEHLRIGIVILACCMGATQSRSETGYQFYRRCAEGKGDDVVSVYKGGYCTGFIAGVMGGLYGGEEIMNGAVPICPGSTPPTYGQIEMIFTNWAQYYPQYLGQDAALAIIAALSDAFPCQARHR